MMLETSLTWLRAGAEPMHPSTFASVRDYVGFDDDTSATLRDLHPHVSDRFPGIVDDFYTTIDSHPDARGVIKGGEEQVTRLKRTLTAWLDSAFLGPHDSSYLEARARIGQAHVRIDLPQEFMFTAMNRIRTQLVMVLCGKFVGDPPRLEAAIRAVNQILDIDLAIMLDTYREDLVLKKQANERLATIGQLAASIGHELRNPLGIVESSLYLMRQRFEANSIRDEKILKHHDKIARQVKNCEKTITDLLELARDRPPRRRPVAASDLVVYGLEGAALPPEVNVETHVGDNVKFDGDADQLRQVLVNLLSNASTAMDGKGTIQIEAARGDRGATLHIRDNGPGVPAEIRDRIFDALFTTRAKGTGLGLALCRRIVAAHRGEIALEPSDSGAHFRIWIPDDDDGGRPS